MSERGNFGYGRGDDYEDDYEDSIQTRFESFCRAHLVHTRRYAQIVAATPRNEDIMVVLVDRTDPAGADIARALQPHMDLHPIMSSINPGLLMGVVARLRVVNALTPFMTHLDRKILSYKGQNPLVLVVTEESIQAFTISPT